MATKLNSKGSGHAGELVSQGHITDSSSWSAPSSSAEDNYIAKHGMSSYANFYLGVDTDHDPSLKGHYKFPFSSNFRDADFSGLRACVQRAAQAGYKDIADRAETLFSQAKTKLGKDKDSKGSVEQVAKGKFLIKSF